MLLTLCVYCLTMNRFCIIILSSLFFILQSFSFVGKEDNLNQLIWFLGTWVNHGNGEAIYEHWVQLNDSVFEGKSYKIKNTDTIILEHIQLLQTTKGLFYIPTVKNQNKEMPIPFELEVITDSSVQFKNLQHDFPQRISYRRSHADQIIAEIVGPVQGKEKRITFLMNRKKD